MLFGGVADHTGRRDSRYTGGAGASTPRPLVKAVSIKAPEASWGATARKFSIRRRRDAPTALSPQAVLRNRLLDSAAKKIDELFGIVESRTPDAVVLKHIFLGVVVAPFRFSRCRSH